MIFHKKITDTLRLLFQLPSFSPPDLVLFQLIYLNPFWRKILFGKSFCRRPPSLSLPARLQYFQLNSSVAWRDVERADVCEYVCVCLYLLRKRTYCSCRRYILFALTAYVATDLTKRFKMIGFCNLTMVLIIKFQENSANTVCLKSVTVTYPLRKMFGKNMLNLYFFKIIYS